MKTRKGPHFQKKFMTILRY